MLTYAAGLSCVEQGGHGGQHAASNQGGEREASMSSSPSTNSRAKPTTLAAAAKAARALLERLPGTQFTCFTGLYWAFLVQQYKYCSFATDVAKLSADACRALYLALSCYYVCVLILLNI